MKRWTEYKPGLEYRESKLVGQKMGITHVIFYGNTPNCKQILRETTVCLTLCHCLWAEFSQRERETDRKERRRRKRMKTKSKEVTRYAKSKQIYVVRRTGKWFLLKFYWRL